MIILSVGELLEGIAKEKKVAPEDCYILITKGNDKKPIASKACFENIPETLGWGILISP